MNQEEINDVMVEVRSALSGLSPNDGIIVVGKAVWITSLPVLINIPGVYFTSEKRKKRLKKKGPPA